MIKNISLPLTNFTLPHLRKSDSGTKLNYDSSPLCDTSHEL